jgi:hypothetical protein
MAKKKRNSLVENINRRKRAGKSRSKSRSTVSKDSYRQMQKGWPNSRKKKSASKKKSTKRKSTTKRSTKKRATKKK